MQVRPITLRAAQAYVKAHHRHNKAPTGHKLSICVQDDEGTVIGVATISRPIARSLDNGTNAEVTRVCTTGGKNVCSMLYGAAHRICKAMGYHKVYTYTQAGEAGSSPRAVGFIRDAELAPRGNWAHQSGPKHKGSRAADYHTGGIARVRWCITFPSNAPTCAPPTCDLEDIRVSAQADLFRGG